MLSESYGRGYMAFKIHGYVDTPISRLLYNACHQVQVESMPALNTVAWKREEIIEESNKMLNKSLEQGLNLSRS